MMMAGCTVAQSARDHGLSWPTVAAAFAVVAAVVLPDEPPLTGLLGIDETRRGRARYRTDPDTGQRVCTAQRWHTGSWPAPAPNHHQKRHRPAVFHTWCAANEIPELHRLASTAEQWWPEVLAFIDTGITNAASEATNRVIKPETRNAYGFGNPTNQQLRSRAASTRRHRRTLTAHRPRSRTG